MTLDDFVKLAPLATLLAALVAFVGAYVAARTSAQIAGDSRIEAERLAAVREWRKGQVDRVLNEINRVSGEAQSMVFAERHGDDLKAKAMSDALHKRSDVLFGGWPIAVASPAFGEALGRTAQAVSELIELLDELLRDAVPADDPAGSAKIDAATRSLDDAVRAVNQAAEEYVFERPAKPSWWRRLLPHRARPPAGRGDGR